jgi:uncharacterized damage-inducible protein DinB/putative sterol carrier protein
MHDITTLERLFRYKAWANDALLTAMQQLDGAAPATEIALRALSHTHVVDRIFAAHMQDVGHAYESANLAQAPNLPELAATIRASDRWYVDYVAALGDAELSETIDFTFTDGAPGRMSRGEMLMHLITHGCLHRGQIGWIMTLGGVDPPADGFTSYLHTAEASARRRPAFADPGVSLAAPVQPLASPSTDPAESPLQALTRRMTVSVAAAAGDLGKTLKFNLKGQGIIFIDGELVSNEDRPADLTLTVTIDDLHALGVGKLSAMAAIASGRLRLSDMGVAVGLQSQMKALFSNMPPR